MKQDDVKENCNSSVSFLLGVAFSGGARFVVLTEEISLNWCRLVDLVKKLRNLRKIVNKKFNIAIDIRRKVC
ncbi:MAG: hypothetical protein IJW62_06190 [Clostridia bacterium]|nr:hypothetical protein [Clostridia bacterium]